MRCDIVLTLYWTDSSGSSSSPFTFIQVDTEDLIGSNLGEWNVDSTSAEVVKQQYSCCVEPYLHMEYIFNISRRSDAYKVAIIAPCLILMFIITCSFLLTPESGEKLWLNGVATICSIMYLIYINYLVPFHQDRVPLIGNNWFSNDIIISNFMQDRLKINTILAFHSDQFLVIFFANTSIFSGIAIFFNVLCIRMVHIRNLSGPPKIIKNVLSGVIGVALCLGSSQVFEW